MCFSAEASFSLAGLLLPAGGYCLRSAFRHNISLWPLSVVPIIFGIQQVCEGFVWVGFARNDSQMVTVSSLLFLFFALSLWPFWVPFIAMIGETSRWRRPVFAIGCLIGLVFGLGAYLPLAMNPHLLKATVTHRSVHYNIVDSPAFDVVPMLLWQLGYMAIVILPVFSSPSRNLILFGVGLVLSALISHIFFWYSFASVWCFFSAIISLYLCWFFRNLTRQ